MSKADRGFASLKKRDPARLREIASQGGIAAHKYGNGHEWTSQEASAAGTKGGAQTKKRHEEAQTQGWKRSR